APFPKPPESQPRAEPDDELSRPPALGGQKQKRRDDERPLRNHREGEPDDPDDEEDQPGDQADDPEESVGLLEALLHASISRASRPRKSIRTSPASVASRPEPSSFSVTRFSSPSLLRQITGDGTPWKSVAATATATLPLPLL